MSNPQQESVSMLCFLIDNHSIFCMVFIPLTGLRQRSFVTAVTCSELHCYWDIYSSLTEGLSLTTKRSFQWYDPYLVFTQPPV
jgi:hypothetical protein